MLDHCGFPSLALGKIQSFTVYHCLFCPLNLSAEIFFPLTTDVTNVSLKQRRCKMKSSHVTCPLPLFTYLKFLNSPAASPNSGSSQPYYLESESFSPLSQPSSLIYGRAFIDLTEFLSPPAPRFPSCICQHLALNSYY